ncbi:Agamous-like MADS-box protein AGL11 [Hibiscus syriacus]|uniref:Agamous-like MADS-box protein AGL11 n=1 Tax=Hibiscus syriacus TaxID=106335 RepID=A0A6A3ADM7_HIBSY|nr:Agamous-like MADS-box protein AGL11 [Hibiscus syriacus]
MKFSRFVYRCPGSLMVAAVWRTNVEWLSTIWRLGFGQVEAMLRLVGAVTTTDGWVALNQRRTPDLSLPSHLPPFSFIILSPKLSLSPILPDKPLWFLLGFVIFPKAELAGVTSGGSERVEEWVEERSRSRGSKTPRIVRLPSASAGMACSRKLTNCQFFAMPKLLLSSSPAEAASMSTPTTSTRRLAQILLTHTVTEINAQYYQQESAKLRQQIQMLHNSNRHLMGDSLSTLTVKELKQVENRLERGITRIRSKKIAEVERLQQANMVTGPELNAIQALDSRNFFCPNVMEPPTTYSDKKILHLGRGHLLVLQEFRELCPNSLFEAALLHSHIVTSQGLYKWVVPLNLDLGISSQLGWDFFHIVP